MSDIFTQRREIIDWPNDPGMGNSIGSKVALTVFSRLLARTFVGRLYNVNPLRRPTQLGEWRRAVCLWNFERLGPAAIGYFLR